MRYFSIYVLFLVLFLRYFRIGRSGIILMTWASEVDVSNLFVRKINFVCGRVLFFMHTFSVLFTLSKIVCFLSMSVTKGPYVEMQFHKLLDELRQISFPVSTDQIYFFIIYSSRA